MPCEVMNLEYFDWLIPWSTMGVFVAVVGVEALRRRKQRVGVAVDGDVWAITLTMLMEELLTHCQE